MNNDLFSNYVIRTMTYTAKLSHKINYKKTCEKLESDDIIMSIEYTDENGNIILKGVKQNPKKTKRKKLFFNQLTIEIKHPDKIVNLKLFLNGKLHITGCRTLNHAIYAGKIIGKKIKEIDCFEEEKDKKKTVSKFTIHLINSNFHIRSNIDRLKLYHLLLANFNINVSFEPTDYPGVKIQYKCYQNPMNEKMTCADVCEWLKNNDLSELVKFFAKNSICGKNLLLLTNKKLMDFGINNDEIRNKFFAELNNKNFIKLVTIIVFRTGQVLITGAKSYYQIENAYNFITKFISENRINLLVQSSTTKPSS